MPEYCTEYENEYETEYVVYAYEYESGGEEKEAGRKKVSGMYS